MNPQMNFSALVLVKNIPSKLKKNTLGYPDKIFLQTTLSRLLNF